VGVGLIPAGGGCKELAARGGDVKKALYLAGQAQVSTSGAHAREMGFLSAGDRISINPDKLLEDAKVLARFTARDYAPPTPALVQVGGDPVFAELKLGIWTYHQGGYISDHDKAVGEKLALVLSGGRSPAPRRVSEQHLLDLEREAFLSLCGNPKTQERIRHTLKTGKPLRN
jgi:3-hydroxyacyl-CoA dehydrogenase